MKSQALVLFAWMLAGSASASASESAVPPEGSEPPTQSETVDLLALLDGETAQRVLGHQLLDEETKNAIGALKSKKAGQAAPDGLKPRPVSAADQQTIRVHVVSDKQLPRLPTDKAIYNRPEENPRLPAKVPRMGRGQVVAVEWVFAKASDAMAECYFGLDDGRHHRDTVVTGVVINSAGEVIRARVLRNPRSSDGMNACFKDALMLNLSFPRGLTKGPIEIVYPWYFRS